MVLSAISVLDLWAYEEYMCRDLPPYRGRDFHPSHPYSRCLVHLRLFISRRLCKHNYLKYFLKLFWLVTLCCFLDKLKISLPVTLYESVLHNLKLLYQELPAVVFSVWWIVTALSCLSGRGKEQKVLYLKLFLVFPHFLEENYITFTIIWS